MCSSDLNITPVPQRRHERMADRNRRRMRKSVLSKSLRLQVSNVTTPPGEHITEKGISVERTKKGDIKYSVNFMVDGERIHRTIGLESEGALRSHAEQFIEAKRTEAREGRLNLPKGRKTSLTLKIASQSYLERETAIGGRNIENKERHLRNTLVPFFGGHRIDKISGFLIDKYKKKDRKSTRRTPVTSLSRMPSSA